jgi:hypothetical protein
MQVITELENKFVRKMLFVIRCFDNDVPKASCQSKKKHLNSNKNKSSFAAVTSIQTIDIHQTSIKYLISKSALLAPKQQQPNKMTTSQVKTILDVTDDIYLINDKSIQKNLKGEKES